MTHAGKGRAVGGGTGYRGVVPLFACALVALAAVLTPSPANAQGVVCETIPPGGQGATATGNQSLACGIVATASGFSSSAYGTGSTASGDNSSAYGAFSRAIGLNAVAVGTGFFGDGLGNNIAGATNDGATASGFGARASGVQSSAYGSFSNASGNRSSAFGVSEASGVNSSAYGFLSNASGVNSSAFGAGARATHANSSAFGTSATTTRDDQQVFGTTSTTYTMPGVARQGSRDAQALAGGPQFLVTSNSVGDLAAHTPTALGLATLSDVAGLQTQINGLGQRDRELADGIAISVAMAQPILLPGQSFALRMGYGNFDGSGALGVSAAGVLSRGFSGPTSSLTLDAGVGFGTETSTAAGRAGMTIGW